MPSDLHVALQEYYAGENGEVEAQVRGFRADVLVGDTIYEIQTRSFTAIRDKLSKLCRTHKVVLVHPVAREKMIVRLDPETGEELSRRRSPKHQSALSVFDELVHAPTLIRRKNFSLEIVVTTVCEYRQDDGAGSWRRKGVSLVGRELVEVVDIHRFEQPRDLVVLLPEGLPPEFTVKEIAATAGISRRLAGKVAYTLREAGAIRQSGKCGNAFMYRVCGRRKSSENSDV